MTVYPSEVIASLRERRQRLEKMDCQGENIIGIDFADLRAKQATALRQREHKEAWEEWCEATKKLFKKAAPGDPTPHVINFLNDMKGRRHHD